MAWSDFLEKQASLLENLADKIGTAEAKTVGLDAVIINGKTFNRIQLYLKACALRAEADGVHLGGDDASPAAARALLGEFAIVGVTLNEPAHVARFAGVRVDYAGVGPFRHTLSKQKLAAVHSSESLTDLIAAAAPLPCYAIGGVTAADWPVVRALGAHGIAVSGAIALADDPVSAAKTLVEAVAG